MRFLAKKEHDGWFIQYGKDWVKAEDQFSIRKAVYDANIIYPYPQDGYKYSFNWSGKIELVEKVSDYGRSGQPVFTQVARLIKPVL